MDTKQLITGSPKEGFYPIVQDTVTVIELNEAVINLTSESSSEDIIAAFDSVEDFTTLLQNVRNTENIVNGVLVNDSGLVGKIFCSIMAHPTQEILYIDGVFTDQYFNITITNNDGTFSCIQNAVHLNREVGDKTNVLILSLENDLANGQKDSPVTAEVSTALKDAISTGKACVIKSANSDILANLQQTGDNVTIIMEQISRVGQTFVAVNTTITVNTATNIISDYQTGALVLETEGDGSKFLSDDGKYKTIDNKPVIINYDDIIEDENHINNIIKTVTDAYKNNKPILLNDTGTLMPLTSYDYISNILSISFIRTSLGTTRAYSFEINGNDYLIAKNVQVELANYKDFLTKDNSSPFTPTADYNPATKKYVDDNINNLITNIEINLTINLSTGGTQTIPNIIEDDNSQFILLNILGLEDAGGDHYILIPRYTTNDGNRTYMYYGLLGTDIMNYGRPTSNIYKLYIIADKNSGLIIKISKYINILTESEYSALGDTSDDDVLYFVTPD